MTRRPRATAAGDALRHKLSPLIQLETASIGAIESASTKEDHSGYVMFFQETRFAKQANVEQMNTLLRLAGEHQVETGGVIEPMLHLQTVALQRASLTAMLTAMRLVQETLVARYRDAAADLEGLERRSMDSVLRRASKQWMLLIAHVAQRKDGDSAHVDVLPLPLTSYFAGDDDRVCMRCLVDRPGERPSLEKPDPYVYLCAACHDDAVASFPPDLASQVPRWNAEIYRDRVLHRALGRPSKVEAIKQVHAVLAGFAPEIPIIPPPKPDATPSVGRTRLRASDPADIDLSRDHASPDELAYTDLLFDFRSVRRSW